tara:strand:+ start:811 stop:1035 length:225 start_codon:yes stop_codon:yes gene_type:complete
VFSISFKVGLELVAVSVVATEFVMGEARVDDGVVGVVIEDVEEEYGSEGERGANGVEELELMADITEVSFEAAA